MKVIKQRWKDLERYIIFTDDLKGSGLLDIVNERDEKGIKAYFWSLYIEEAYRNRGYASSILDKAESICMFLNEPDIHLEYDQHETPHYLFNYYNKIGYKNVMHTQYGVLLKKDLNEKPKNKSINTRQKR